MGRSRGVWAAVLGVLSALTLPVAIVATRYSDSYDLLHAAFAIPPAVVLGIVAMVLARRARMRDEATLGRGGEARGARVGRAFGILGLCIAASATIALSVYELLIAVE